MKFLSIALVLLATPAMSAEKLSLNDIPMVLGKLQDCHPVQNIFGQKSMQCKLNRPWIAVDADGKITFFYKSGNGLEVTGSGRSIDEALRSLVSKMNAVGSDAKDAVNAVSDLLPTQ